MSPSELSLDCLVGRRVLARDGTSVGRIEEIRANDNAEVVAFLVGEQALLERLSALGLFAHRRADTWSGGTRSICRIRCGPC